MASLIRNALKPNLHLRSPPPKENNLERETLDSMEWLAEQSPREQMVFGDLILGFEQFTLDSHHHRV